MKYTVRTCGSIFFFFIFVTKIMAQDWDSIISSTKANTWVMQTSPKYSEDAENAFGGAEGVKINWEKIKIAADQGNSLAQYVHSQHLLALSRTLFNDERKNVRFEAYMYLLIAAVKGDFLQAVEAYNCAFDFTREIPVFEEDKDRLLWIREQAEELSIK